MKHLGGSGIAWFMLSDYPGLHIVAWEYTCGWPPRNKETTMSSLLSELPVQPYDNMGSVLTN
jgi:hypothetical protein